MVRAQYNPLRWSLVISCLLLAGFFHATPVRAQGQDEDSISAGSTYQTAESSDVSNVDPAGDAVTQYDDTAAPPSSASEGPVRMARFAYVRGNVTWRADDSMDWSQAANNLPLRQGAQVWVAQGGRAELQFDDGSALRLGNGALVTLKVLYSDADGEFTQITLNDGLATLYARHEHSIYQIDTPLVSVKTTGPSRIRLGAGAGVEIAIQKGRATIEGSQGKVNLQSGDYLDLPDANATYDPRQLPAEDGWDRWNDEMDRILVGDTAPNTYKYCPANIALVAGDLDECGTWRYDPTYGHVWCPHVTVADWRPYCYGHWTWVNPFGWTWVSDESWGWAPYHYGTWVYQPYGWAWVPGPAHQYWCPAVVNFCEYEGRIAWAPLAPTEVRYPSFLSIGFHSGSWSLFFSIGQAAVYYPGAAGYCVARPYNTVYVNHLTVINNIYRNDRFDGSLAGSHFVPMNARRAPGVTIASMAAFGGQGDYRPMPAHQEALFSQGRSYAPSASGRLPFSGPISVRPTPQAMTPTRTLLREVQPPSSILERPTYHAPLPVAVRRSGSTLPAEATAGSRARSMGGGMTANSGRNSGSPAEIGSRGDQRESAAQLPTRSRTPSTMERQTSPRNSGTVMPPSSDERISHAGGSRYDNSSRTMPSQSSAADAAARARASLGMPGGTRSGQNESFPRSERQQTYSGRNPDTFSGYNRGSDRTMPGNREPAYRPSNSDHTPRSQGSNPDRFGNSSTDRSGRMERDPSYSPSPRYNRPADSQNDRFGQSYRPGQRDSMPSERRQPGGHEPSRRDMPQMPRQPDRSYQPPQREDTGRYNRSSEPQRQPAPSYRSSESMRSSPSPDRQRSSSGSSSGNSSSSRDRRDNGGH